MLEIKDFGSFRRQIECGTNCCLLITSFNVQPVGRVLYFVSWKVFCVRFFLCLCRYIDKVHVGIHYLLLPSSLQFGFCLKVEVHLNRVFSVIFFFQFVISMKNMDMVVLR